MSGRNKGGKAKIQMTKPEPPPFLQRIREQMLANEGVERREQAELKRKLRPNRPDDPDDDPLIVQLNQDDLTEEEYKRIKHGKYAKGSGLHNSRTIVATSHSKPSKFIRSIYSFRNGNTI